VPIALAMLADGIAQAPVAFDDHAYETGRPAWTAMDPPRQDLSTAPRGSTGIGLVRSFGYRLETACRDRALNPSECSFLRQRFDKDAMELLALEELIDSTPIAPVPTDSVRRDREQTSTTQDDEDSALPSPSVRKSVDSIVDRFAQERYSRLSLCADVVRYTFEAGPLVALCRGMLERDRPTLGH
jgi:hypothetical protein